MNLIIQTFKAQKNFSVHDNFKKYIKNQEEMQKIYEVEEKIIKNRMEKDGEILI